MELSEGQVTSLMQMLAYQNVQLSALLFALDRQGVVPREEWRDLMREM